MTDMPTILSNIIAEKQQEIEAKKQRLPIEFLENIIVEQNDTPRGFYRALQKKYELGKPAVIAEIKKAMPNQGVICENFDPEVIAKSYEKAGATCLSVLTDTKFYQGSDCDLDKAREASTLPILRKDFVVDEYQIFEARSIGADCIVLLATCLTHEQMYSLTRLAHDLGMDVLVEVHSHEELEKTAGLPIRMLGINNCNLHTFETDLETTFELSMALPEDILIVTAGGIKTQEDIRLLHSAGVNCFLIGEILLRQEKPGEELEQLIGGY